MNAFLEKISYLLVKTGFSVHDELCFIVQQYGFKWGFWSMERGLTNGFGLLKLIKAFCRIRRQGVTLLPPPYRKDIPQSFDPREWRILGFVMLPHTLLEIKKRSKAAQAWIQINRPVEVLVKDHHASF